MHDTVKLPRIPARPTRPLRLSAEAEVRTPRQREQAQEPTTPRSDAGAQYPVILPDQSRPTPTWGSPAPDWSPAGPAHHVPTHHVPAHHSPAHPGPARPRGAGSGALRWLVSLLLFLLLAVAAMPILVYLALTVQSTTGLGTSLSPLGDTQTVSVLLLGLAVAGAVGFLPGFAGFTLGTRSPGWGAFHGLWTSPLLVVAGALLTLVILWR